MRTAILALLLLALGAAAAGAQDSAVAQPPDAARPGAAARDTAPRPPLSPMGALWRSLLLPGWGQARLDRQTAAAIFLAWEGVTLGMSIKTQHELDYLRRTGSGRVSAKAREREDWLILLAFNHLFSALEAYVSAHLWDFPGDLRLDAVPGGAGVRVVIPLSVP